MKKKLLTFKKYVTFHGWQPESIVYRNSDIVIITSYINNFPYVALEAKSYGIPSLVYCTEGGINEIIKNNYDGIIINSGKKSLKVSNYINKIKFNYKFFSYNAYINAKKYNANIKIPILIKDELLK